MAKEESKSKPKSEPEPGMSASSFVFGFITLLLVISFLLGKVPDIFSEDTAGSSKFSFSTAIPAGELVDGKRVIANQVVAVRQEPGGASLGDQEKRATGEIFGTAVDAFGLRWWRVIFDEPPSGWVSEDTITAHVGILRLINIFPIIYDWYMSIWIWLSIILLFIFVYLRVSYKIFDKKMEKKKHEEKEQRQLRINARNQGANVDPIVPGVPGLPTGQSFSTSSASSGPVILKDIGASPIAKRRASEKWNYIQSLLKSYNTNDWKQAVIEADIILEEMLREAGYAGEGVGEMLKNANENDFITLQKAWEGHKVRNSIAHSGADYRVSRQDAERAINNFKEVFEEFYYL